MTVDLQQLIIDHWEEIVTSQKKVTIQQLPNANVSTKTLTTILTKYIDVKSEGLVEQINALPPEILVKSKTGLKLGSIGFHAMIDKLKIEYPDFDAEAYQSRVFKTQISAKTRSEHRKFILTIASQIVTKFDALSFSQADLAEFINKFATLVVDALSGTYWSGESARFVVEKNEKSK